jgi:hypothetical protein
MAAGKRILKTLKKNGKTMLLLLVAVGVIGLLVSLVRIKYAETYVPEQRCSPGKHYDALRKKCVCDTGTNWDSVMKKCVRPPPARVIKKWSNVTINRFGSYKNFGQGRGFAGTVACTAQFPKGQPGIWTAINPQVMGFGSSVPCGAKLRVTDPRTGKSQELVVMDGGGSDGIDIDDDGYRALVPENYDGKRGGYTVERLA